MIWSAGSAVPAPLRLLRTAPDLESSTSFELLPSELPPNATAAALLSLPVDGWLRSLPVEGWLRSLPDKGSEEKGWEVLCAESGSSGSCGACAIPRPARNIDVPATDTRTSRICRVIIEKRFFGFTCCFRFIWVTPVKSIKRRPCGSLFTFDPRESAQLRCHACVSELSFCCFRQ